MLTHKSLVEAPFIPGVLTLLHPDTQLFHFRQPYFNGHTPGADPADSWYQPVLYTDFSSYSIFFNSLNYVAIPFIGLMLMSVIVWSKHSNIIATRNSLTPVLLKGWVIWGIGSIIAGSIVIGPYIWETTRFLQLGFFIGVVCYSYVVVRSHAFFSRPGLGYFFGAILALATLYGSVEHLRKVVSDGAFSEFFSTAMWRDGGRISALVRTNQVACGGHPSERASEEEKYFCRERLQIN